MEPTSGGKVRGAAGPAVCAVAAALQNIRTSDADIRLACMVGSLHATKILYCLLVTDGRQKREVRRLIVWPEPGGFNRMTAMRHPIVERSMNHVLPRPCALDTSVAG